MRQQFKALYRWGTLSIAALIMLPVILLTRLEKHLNAGKFLYSLFAQMLALLPGEPGNIFRRAYYFFLLDQCSIYITVSFGSYFTSSHARIGRNSGIGAYCIIGDVDIGSGVRIASKVSVVTQLNEHGSATGDMPEDTQRICIGNNCWIGEGAAIGASIGANSIVALGAVVMRDIEPASVCMGNPARVTIKRQVQAVA